MCIANGNLKSRMLHKAIRRHASMATGRNKYTAGWEGSPSKETSGAAEKDLSKVHA